LVAMLLKVLLEASPVIHEGPQKKFWPEFVSSRCRNWPVCRPEKKISFFENERERKKKRI